MNGYPVHDFGVIPRYNNLIPSYQYPTQHGGALVLGGYGKARKRRKRGRRGRGMGEVLEGFRRKILYANEAKKGTDPGIQKRIDWFTSRGMEVPPHLLAYANRLYY